MVKIEGLGPALVGSESGSESESGSGGAQNVRFFCVGEGRVEVRNEIVGESTGDKWFHRSPSISRGL